MARFPTFDEYHQSGRYKAGINRCDELLNKSPNDVQLLTTKLRLLYTFTPQDAIPILEQLASLKLSTGDLTEVLAIEDAVLESQRDFWPPPNTTGPLVAKVWDGVVKGFTSPQRKADALCTRIVRASMGNRILDAQQALIQLKALQPRHRVFYMAHAAFTQLLSADNGDLQGRLALGLARKAVKDGFDEEKGLDCRVPGQIFALHDALADLRMIEGKSFAESKQVYDALRRHGGTIPNGTAAKADEIADPTTVSASEWVAAELVNLRQHFSTLISCKASKSAVQQFAVNAIRLYHTASQISQLNSSSRRRGPADACFLAISALVRLWTQSAHRRSSYLLQAAFLAQTLLLLDPHVHEARLMLVHLYMRLGLSSLAMRSFVSLNIKEIQYDTVGHALFTRLSITHPHPTRTSDRSGKKAATSIDPTTLLALALAVYDRHEARLAGTQSDILEHGQTGMVFDLHSLRASLRCSYTKRLAILERRRIARLLAHAETKRQSGKIFDDESIGPRVTANWLSVEDNRDFSAAFDYGLNVQRTLQQADDSSTVPGVLYLAYTLATDTAWSLATNRPALIVDIADLITRLEYMLDSAEADLSGITQAEYLCLSLTTQVLRLLHIASTPSSDMSEGGQSSFWNAAYAALLKAVQALNLEPLLSSVKQNTHNATSNANADANSGEISPTYGMQEMYLLADTFLLLHFATNYLSLAPAASPECRALFGHWEEVPWTALRRLFEAARERAEKIDGDGVRRWLEQSAETWEGLQSRENFGEGVLKTFCEDVTHAAKEGWEGIGRVREAFDDVLDSDQ